MRRRDIQRSIVVSLGLHAALAMGLIAAPSLVASLPARSETPSNAIMVTLTVNPLTAHPPAVHDHPTRPRPAPRAEAIPSVDADAAPAIPDIPSETGESPSPPVDAPDESPSLVSFPVVLASDGTDDQPDDPSSDAQSNAMDAYRALVLTALERAKRYPLFARVRGMEGTVEIAFIIQPDGQVSHPEVVTSSQFRILDEAALGMVRRVGTLPPPPELAPLRFPARIAYRLDAP